MRRFGSILAVFALVIILVVTEIVIIKSASKYEPQVGVVFAKERITEGTEIAPDMLEVRNVDLSYVHRMSLRSAADAVAKRAGTDIEAGEMILSGRLNSGEMEVIEVSDAGKKLFSVEFKADQANGWWLTTDRRVDIIYIPEEKSVPPAARGEPAGDEAASAASAGGDSITDRIQVLKDIRIAALIDENGKLLKNIGRATLPRYVSFEVTDEQAGILAYAKSHGRLELSVVPGK